MKILLCGKAGSGKNAFLKVARDLFPELQIQEGKFANKLYESMYAVQRVVGVSYKKDGKLLQLLGEHYRDIDPDFWVNLTFESLDPYENRIFTDGRFPEELLGEHYRDIDPDFLVNLTFESLDPYENRIFTDGRFPEELLACKRKGYKLVRILRQEELRLNSLGNRDPNHISETALDHLPDSYFDYIVNNHQEGLHTIEYAVTHIINEIRRKV